jgi:hypothetical protein
MQPPEMTLPRSYADITKRNLTQPEETTNVLAKFLDELKKLTIITTKYYGSTYAYNAYNKTK